MKYFLSFLIISLAVSASLVACAPDAQTLAARGVSSNAEWQPLIQEFDGVEMVLVPAGCFMMGSQVDTGNTPNSPEHEQCFDNPFWIDRTEVTNAQFMSEGHFPGDNRPREQITWYEAQAHCEGRGARLPTEAEWEYAARGPDNLMYPWGNSFVADNTVYSQNSQDGTANVGSRPAGASWVGALDMAGNVREWTNSLNKPYPYDPLDGREAADSGESVIAKHRIVRGGAWDCLDFDINLFTRLSLIPSFMGEDTGFRCALDV
jgi:formylglycine-generating enzyme required for sulfatase activity